MLCEKCQRQQATVQLQLRINGHQEKHHLCSACYKEERSKLGAAAQMGNMPFDMEPFFNHAFFNGSADFSSMSGQPQQPSMPQTGQDGHRGGGLLDQFGRNLTSNAKAGLIDPVIGREKEIKRVIEILNRRTKNNPVLIGEPGVGKTAIAEGLALKIAEGQVPAKLQAKEVYLLDVASLVSNTGIRGQFEERMKQLIGELQSRKNVILFIDEIHQLVGAGSAEGSMDAGNILKPALARGELQLVGATTLSEYRQIEKDGALERRFQPVQVDEPTTEEAISILKGLKDHYESFHGVTYTEEALQAAVELSSRYIQDRFLPDKAIDLMDEAGSKLNLTIETGDLEAIKQRLAAIHREKEEALAKEDYEKAAVLRDEEGKLEHALENGNPSQPVVTVEHIQEIIAEKTGIPVGKVQEDEAQRMKNLQAELFKKGIGQEEAVQKVAKAIRRSRAGLKAKNRPIGSFLFVGPTGVGKTELSKALAEELFGTKEAMVRLDMSEYMEKHSVSKLIGSPPGYVGHEEAGQLTEKVRRHPYSIVLLDEIEKAHPDVMHMFLQILEDGRLTDSQGRTVNFKNTVIIMTSNAGAGMKRTTLGFNEEGSKVEKDSILDSLSQYFKPEFLNRFDSIIEFNGLEKEHLIQIVDIMLAELDDMLKEEGISLEVSTEVKEKLAELGYSPAFGARPLRRAIQEHLEDNIADFMYEEPEVKDVKAILDDDDIKIIKQ
ncbi:ATP-dependent Clp protease ATP-binding subunit [Bacillus testis]|uniref:ATP-dependent Clp protease ATP-binding subunit n=1 Tax=Bacillus testis TaxID=1622072 RepID=UPI00067EBED0|nr:ATP-dependent Clp protease ATP-binding subunit [Bacillus testis]